MINAAEARIVTNENIGKEIEREKIKTQEEAKHRQFILNRLNEIAYKIIYEDIATRAAQGYSFTCVRIGDSTYNKNIHLDIDSTRCPTNYVYNNTKLLVSFIHGHFSTLGYKIENIHVHSIDKGYHDVYTIKISW